MGTGFCGNPRPGSGRTGSRPSGAGFVFLTLLGAAVEISPPLAPPPSPTPAPPPPPPHPPTLSPPHPLAAPEQIDGFGWRLFLGAFMGSGSRAWICDRRQKREGSDDLKQARKHVQLLHSVC